MGGGGVKCILSGRTKHRIKRWRRRARRRSKAGQHHTSWRLYIAVVKMWDKSSSSGRREEWICEHEGKSRECGGTSQKCAYGRENERSGDMDPAVRTLQ